MIQVFLILFLLYKELPLDLVRRDISTGAAKIVFDNRWDMTVPDLTGSQVIERN